MSEENASCPRCGKVLVDVSGRNGRFLECVCEYKFDSWLSREARYDEWDPRTWFLKPDQRQYGFRKGPRFGEVPKSLKRYVTPSRGREIL